MSQLLDLRLSAVISVILVTVAGALVLPGTADAQGSYAVVHAFNGSDGYQPVAGVIQGLDGMLYGTAVFGGSANSGTVFQMATDGSSFTPVYAFSGTDGARPWTSMVQGADLTLYGTTTVGGANNLGTVFQVAPDGSFSVLHDFTGFPDGATPSGSLILGNDGLLYGSTQSGGAESCACGVIFSMPLDGSGSFNVLHTFTGPDGSQPLDGVIQGLDGMLYGTASRGTGASVYGVIFSVAPDGSSFSVVHSFNFPEGALPFAGLIQDPADGTLYGTTWYGTPGDGGMVFRIATDGSLFRPLAFFGGSFGGGTGSRLLLSSDGWLYGTAEFGGGFNGGTIFRVAPDGSEVDRLYSLDAGATPSGGLIQGLDGVLYGTAINGGPGNGGVVFSFSAP